MGLKVIVLSLILTAAQITHAGMIKKYPNQNKKISSTKEGGISGGGGGVQPPKPIDLDYVRRNLPAVYSFVYGSLNYMEHHIFNLNHHTPPEAYEVDVFRTSPTIFEALQGVTIELKVQGPCLDASGNPVDGSVHNVPAGHICLSADSFIQKSNDQAFFQDAAALIVHELSHIAGADETYAERLQAHANSLMPRFDPYMAQQSSRDFVMILDWQLNVFNESTSRITDNIGTCSRLKYMDVMVREIENAIWVYKSLLLVLRGDQYAHFQAKQMRINILKDYFCSLDPKESRLTNLESQQVLDVGFASDSSVDLLTFTNRFNEFYHTTNRVMIYSNPTDEPEIMARPANVDAAIMELGNISSYMQSHYHFLGSVMEQNFWVIEN